MTVIGLTGGIASGKSTAARYLKDQGASVIDADILGHQAYEPGTPAHTRIVEVFGEDVLGADSQIDRKVLGSKVFGQEGALKKLTDIVWPEIRRMAEAQIAAIRESEPAAVVVLEAAVLFEAGWEDAVDEVWVVVVERDTAVARAMARDGADEAAIQSRIDAQLSNDERKARAHVVIDNSNEEAALLSQLDEQWARVRPAKG
ncbi:MAG: dephospho-CoA kinase [Gammaproteobacteria bacterium]|nr:dephospho-CoA kinase [Gammaproteobacteria bacterium]